MKIFPAIDIIDGQCVRLVKGEFDTAHKVFESPLEAAKSFEASGATFLHTVDLDGARKGEPLNQHIVKEILGNTNLKVQVGGGIRTIAHIQSYIDLGVSRVILGSIALKNPTLVKEAVALFGKKIAVGIDADNGFAKADGWTKSSTIDFLVLSSMMFSIGVRTIIYTDISRDGTLSGVNLSHLSQIHSALPELKLIASGGVAGIKDIKDIKNLGIYGVICGKALYADRLSLEDALEVAGGTNVN